MKYHSDGRFAMRVICVLVVIAFTSTCATRPKNISATYVSPMLYQNYTCDQIRAEMTRVNQHVLEASGQQKKAADRDAAAMGVGLVLFWPALFFLMGGDKKEEIARLKGEYDALETVAIQKNCFTPDELNAIKAEAAKPSEPVAAPKSSGRNLESRRGY